MIHTVLCFFVPFVATFIASLLLLTSHACTVVFYSEPKLLCVNFQGCCLPFFRWFFLLFSAAELLRLLLYLNYTPNVAIFPFQSVILTFSFMYESTAGQHGKITRKRERAPTIIKHVHDKIVRFNHFSAAVLCGDFFHCWFGFSCKCEFKWSQHLLESLQKSLDKLKKVILVKSIWPGSVTTRREN